MEKLTHDEPQHGVPEELESLVAFMPRGRSRCMCEGPIEYRPIGEVVLKEVLGLGQGGIIHPWDGSSHARIGLHHPVRG